MSASRDAIDDTAESGNPVEPQSSAHGSASVSRMSIPAAPIDVPNAQTEAMLKISQDLARVLERLTTPRAPTDLLRKHGADEFMGSTLDETEKQNTG